MLRASNRALRSGGLLAFYVIALPDDIDSESVDFGPEWAAADGGYVELMNRAGFHAVEMIDVTGDYEVTLDALISAWDEEADSLRALLGDEEFSDRQQRRRRSLQAIGKGLLKRYLVSGVK